MIEALSLSIAQLLWGLVVASILVGFGYLVTDYVRWSRQYEQEQQSCDTPGCNDYAACPPEPYEGYFVCTGHQQTVTERPEDSDYDRASLNLAQDDWYDQHDED